MLDPDLLQQHVSEAWTSFSELHPEIDGEADLRRILTTISESKELSLRVVDPIDTIKQLELFVNHNLRGIQPGFPTATGSRVRFRLEDAVRWLFEVMDGADDGIITLPAAYELNHRMRLLRAQIQAEPQARTCFELQSIYLLLGEVESSLDRLLLPDRRLALAMALHTRLGEGAPIQRLGADLMNQIRPG